MSVQAGIWNFDGKPVDRKLLADISEYLEHQGPDGEFCHVDGPVALLYRPFHTTAESRWENQPYFSHRGFILTWDGRLDNRDELIPKLRSELEANPTDVAIVAAAFDRWESDCFHRIIGDWAVSVWKPEQREVIFAVDYMAIRHIFYYLKKDRIWWSTDLAPLVLFSGDTFHLEDDYIAGYLAHDPEARLTPYKEIREVPPGQFVRVGNGNISVERYWRFSPKSRIRYATDAEYEENFRYLFRQSVGRRLRSDSPVLAELSGGLDSSSIVCVADTVLARERAGTCRLDTLSYYDKTEPNGDDWTYFRKVEAYRGQTGYHIDASKLGSSPATFQYRDFVPLPGYFAAAREIESERATVIRKGGYRVVLSGIAGDEFMGGIPDPSAQLADLVMQFNVSELARQLTAWGLAKRRPWVHLLAKASLHLLPAHVTQYLITDANAENWIEPLFARRTHLAIRLVDVDEHFGLWLPTRRSYVAALQLIANKLAKCRSPILAPEEARYPYLDQNLIEFILSIPASQMLRPGERRSLMRRSLLGIVPGDILARRTKHLGTRTPINALINNWGELLAAFEPSLASKLGYINQTFFVRALHAAKNGKTVHLSRLLRTISLEFWLRLLAVKGIIHPANETDAAAYRSVAEKSIGGALSPDLSH